MNKMTKQSKLTPENAALLKRIAEYGVEKQRPCHPKSKDFVYLWEGRVFRKFILRRKDLKQKFTQLFEGEGNINISFQTFSVCYSGMGQKSTQNVFFLAAELHGCTPTEYLREFVEFCINEEGFTPRAFKEDDEVIQKLLGKNKAPEKTFQSSLQDIVTINSEIDEIRAIVKSGVWAIKQHHDSVVLV